jgi:hypothetical protein
LPHSPAVPISNALPRTELSILHRSSNAEPASSNNA